MWRTVSGHTSGPSTAPAPSSLPVRPTSTTRPSTSGKASLPQPLLSLQPRTGCQLAASNPLTDWLATAGVTPDDSALYEMKEVWQAVMAGTGGFRPHIDCTEVKGEALISEVDKLC